MNSFIQQQSERLTATAQAVETRVRRLSIVNLLLDTYQAYTADNCSMIAAALSYYALLSIFPLMLFLIAISSAFIPAERVTRLVVNFLAADFPAGARTLQTALEQAIQARGVISLVSAGSFLWSAMGVFNMLQRGINRAFRVQHPRPQWRQTIVSVVMVASVGLLFVLSFGLTTWLRVAFHFRMLLRTSLAVDVLADVIGFVISVVVFSLLYQFIPFGENVKWRDVFFGAVVASILWHIAKFAFAWYITSYASLNLVYGPLGTVVAIMLWGYVTAAILLLGAELTAIKSGAHQRQRRGDEWWGLAAR